MVLGTLIYPDSEPKESWIAGDHMNVHTGWVASRGISLLGLLT